MLISIKGQASKLMSSAAAWLLLMSLSMPLFSDSYLTDSDHMTRVLEQLRGMSLSRYGIEFVTRIDEKIENDFVNDELGKSYLRKYDCKQMYSHIDLPRPKRPANSQYANFAADPKGYTLQYFYSLYISEEMGIFDMFRKGSLFNKLSSSDNFVMTVDDGVEVSLKRYALSDGCSDFGFWRLYNVIGARIIEDYITVLGPAPVESLPYQY